MNKEKRARTVIFCFLFLFWDTCLYWWGAGTTDPLRQPEAAAAMPQTHTAQQVPMQPVACIIYWHWDPNSLCCLEDHGVVKYSGTAAVKHSSQQASISLTSSEGEWLPVLGFIVLQAQCLDRSLEGNWALRFPGGRWNVCENESFWLQVLTFPREDSTLDFMDIWKYSQLLLKTGISQTFISVWLDCRSERKMTFFIVTWPYAECACVSQAKGLRTLG